MNDCYTEKFWLDKACTFKCSIHSQFSYTISTETVFSLLLSVMHYAHNMYLYVLQLCICFSVAIYILSRWFSYWAFHQFTSLCMCVHVCYSTVHVFDKYALRAVRWPWGGSRGLKTFHFFFWLGRRAPSLLKAQGTFQTANSHLTHFCTLSLWGWKLPVQAV